MKKVTKSNNDALKLKGFIKSLLRLGLYIILFGTLVFIVLSVSSYFWLESLRLDMSDVMSGVLDEIPQ